MNKSTASRILAHLRSLQTEMVRLLSDCALQESPSADPQSQDAVFGLLTDQLLPLGFRCRRLSGTTSGGQLMAVPRDTGKRSPRQLLLGHCDTVWPHGTLGKMPVESRDGRLHGPGVYDMKGGLVQAIFALRTLRDLGLQPTVAPLFFINSDVKWRRVSTIRNKFKKKNLEMLIEMKRRNRQLIEDQLKRSR